jgi:ethanolamine ammonia-lyase large subunit
MTRNGDDQEFGIRDVLMLEHYTRELSREVRREWGSNVLYDHTSALSELTARLRAHLSAQPGVQFTSDDIQTLDELAAQLKKHSIGLVVDPNVVQTVRDSAQIKLGMADSAKRISNSLRKRQRK